LLLHADHEPCHPHEWEQWFKATRTAIRKRAIAADPGRGTPDEPVAIRLVHASCLRRHTANQALAQHFSPPTRLQGLLEPDVV
jgi:RNA-directed DNA polymerase